MGRIRDGHIGYFEAIALIVITIMAKIILPLPAVLAKAGQGATWMIIIIGMVVSMTGFLPLAGLLKKYPKQSIIMITEKVMGKYIGTLFNLIFLASFLLSFIIGLREFTELIKISVLPLTPISVVITLFLLASMYIVYQGIEPLARGNWLFMPFIVLALIIIIIGVYPFMHLSFLYPLLGPGVMPVLKTGFLSSGLFGDMIFLGIIAPYIRDTNKIFKIGFWGLIIGGIAMIVVELSFIMTFMEESQLITFPVYQMARLIYFGRFLQRIEVLFIFIWTFVGMARIPISLYSSVVTIAQTLQLPIYKPLIFPVGILFFAISLFPMSFLQAVKLDMLLRILTFASGIVIPLIIFLVDLAKKHFFHLGMESGGENYG